MMDVSARYEALCLELGHLTLELEARLRRKKALMEEMQILQRLAAAIKGANHVPVDKRTPTHARASAVTATPSSTWANAPSPSEAETD